MYNALLPAFVVMCTSAPFDNKIVTTSSCPSSEATINGVLPCPVTLLTILPDASMSNNKPTISACPFSQARCKVVSPPSSWLALLMRVAVLTWTPACANNRTILAWPCPAAKTIGVCLLESILFKSALASIKKRAIFVCPSFAAACKGEYPSNVPKLISTPRANKARQIGKLFCSAAKKSGVAPSEGRLNFIFGCQRSSVIQLRTARK